MTKVIKIFFEAISNITPNNTNIIQLLANGPNTGTQLTYNSYIVIVIE